jgi:hypothetical protein
MTESDDLTRGDIDRAARDEGQPPEEARDAVRSAAHGHDAGIEEATAGADDPGHDGDDVDEESSESFPASDAPSRGGVT